MQGLYICSFDPTTNTNSYYEDWAYEFEQQGFDIFNSYIQNPFELIKILRPFNYDLIIFGFSLSFLVIDKIIASFSTNIFSSIFA